MPRLDSPLHLDMLRTARHQRRLTARLRRAFDALLGRGDLYGLEWGDPDVCHPLRYVRDHYLLPYVTPETTVVEIGPGGGRWTRYLLAARRVYAVDYHDELLRELGRRVRGENLVPIHNRGTDFPGVPHRSVDFIFSFGAFVHLELDAIRQYLHNMRPLLKPRSNVVIQYADQTKPMAQEIGGFSDLDPERMRERVRAAGYFVREEDLKTLWHSSIIRFGLPLEEANGDERGERTGGESPPVLSSS